MDKILSCIQTYLSFAKDIFTIASLAIAGFVAIKGLQTWRHQLKGTADYELSKRLLKATYRLRDALQSARNPLMLAGEIVYAIKETHLDVKPEDKNFHAASTAAVYQVRWKPVQEAYQALELEVLEAEVIWGPDARAATTAIRKNINSLSTALSLYLADMQPNGPRMLNAETRDTFERIVFSMVAPEEDKYWKELNSAVYGIEEVARPHLIR
jgi:hypothetical protein